VFQDYYPAIIGGLLIGLSATLMMLLIGRITGISGISWQAINISNHLSNNLWRWCFLLGLALGAWIAVNYFKIEVPQVHSKPILAAVAGLIVGIGTKLGSGCTSGHGICGIGRLSFRSIVATIIFMITGIVTVFITQKVIL
jgi:uncharacterized membrane protein YedE/YeeE